MRNGEIIAVYRHEMEAALNWHGDDTVDVVANETWHVGVHPHFNSHRGCFLLGTQPSGFPTP